MKLGEGVEQAMHSVALLSDLSEDSVLPAKAIASFYGTSLSYLLKHLQALSAAGILTSVPGPRGGYKLARPSNKITLLDLLLAVEGHSYAFRCREIRRRGPSQIDSSFYTAQCGISAAMLSAERLYRDALAKTTIADVLAQSEESNGPAVAARTCAYIAAHGRSLG